MGALSDLKPERVFYYFEEICRIPHGSYNEKAISDYLVECGKHLGLAVIQDEFNNVIMFVDASAGRENEQPIIMQGHMDMVCEKRSDCDIDMEKEGLRVIHDDEYVFAEGTSLGGDDGIAIAYMLAIAEDKELSHPPLEYIITVSEEVGMEGAGNIDLSMLKGRQMLNLDSEDEGIFLSSCAGGLSSHSKLPVKRVDSDKLTWYELEVKGLLGGHSGCEIHKGRANANKVLGRALYELNKVVAFSIAEMEGGKKDNAIPLESKALIGTSDYEVLAKKVAELDKILKAEYVKSDAGIELTLTEVETVTSKSVLTKESFNDVLAVLMNLPDGVQGMSMAVEGLVETSLNLGIMMLYENHLLLQHAIRSSVTTKKYFVADQVESLVTRLGGTVERRGDYPAWEYKEESVVRPRVIALYEKMYGKTPVVEGIHAGLECGLLAGKLPGLDCVAMGPDILDIHTTAERLDIASVKRVYEFIIEYLKLEN